MHKIALFNPIMGNIYVCFFVTEPLAKPHAHINAHIDEHTSTHTCSHTQKYAHGNLVVPFANSAAMQTRSFSVVGPKTWNGLPVDLRHLPNGACSQFHHLLKTVLFRLAWVGSASE